MACEDRVRHAHAVAVEGEGHDAEGPEALNGLISFLLPPFVATGALLVAVCTFAGCCAPGAPRLTVIIPVS